jgi:hypothetical protein
MHPRSWRWTRRRTTRSPAGSSSVETLKYGDETSRWRAHGVSRGVRDYYYKQTQSDDWYVHRITAMHRPDWTEEERKAKAELYGSRDHPDYRRNILGLHGDAMSSLFVLHRLMACVDSNEDSDYNANVYTHIRINDEWLRDSGMPIEALLDLPVVSQGVQARLDRHGRRHDQPPVEILVFGAETKPGTRGNTTDGERIRCLARIHLERISAMDQLRVMNFLADFYRPSGVRHGPHRPGPADLPVRTGPRSLHHCTGASAVRGYNFSEKIVVAFEPIDDDERRVGRPRRPGHHGQRPGVLSDQLRLLVDQAASAAVGHRHAQGVPGAGLLHQESATNPYGKKEFNKGKFHALDAARMAALAWSQEMIEKQMSMQPDQAAVMLTWADGPMGVGAIGAPDDMFTW